MLCWIVSVFFFSLFFFFVQIGEFTRSLDCWTAFWLLLLLLLSFVNAIKRIFLYTPHEPFHTNKSGPDDKYHSKCISHKCLHFVKLLLKKAHTMSSQPTAIATTNYEKYTHTMHRYVSRKSSNHFTWTFLMFWIAHTEYNEKKKVRIDMYMNGKRDVFIEKKSECSQKK